MADKELNLEAFKQWGKQGGKARAKRLSPERRSEIAKIAGSAPKRKRSGSGKLAEEST